MNKEEEMKEQKYRSVKIFSSVIINYLIFLKIRTYFKKVYICTVILS